MNTADAGAYLGVNASRVRQLVKDGKLSPRTENTPRGPVHWFAKTDLERLKEERERENQERRGRKGRPFKTH